MFIVSFLTIFNIVAFKPVLDILFKKGDFASNQPVIPKISITEDEPNPSKPSRKEFFINLIKKYPSLKPVYATYQNLKNKKILLEAEMKNYLIKLGAMKALAFIGVIILIIEVLKFLLTFTSDYTTNYVGLSIIKNLKFDLYEHIINSDMSFLESKTTGHLMTRISGDVSGVRDSLMIVCDKILDSPIRIFSLLALLLYMNYKMTLIIFIFIPLTSFIIVRFGRSVRKVSKKERRKVADIGSTMQEILGGVRIVKAFRMEHYELERFREQNDKHFEYLLKRRRVRILSDPMMDLLGTTAVVVILLIGGYFVRYTKAMSSSEFFVFLYALSRLYAPIKKISNANNEIQTGLAHAERIFQILDTKSKVVESPNAVSIPSLTYNIVFENVTFEYKQGVPVLKNISFTIGKGKRVAIVGRSGAGKTTIASLIPRFYDPTEGRILIDGTDIREATFDSLRGQIGIVTQEGVLFDDTIRNNIAYGRKDETEERIIAAAKAANAHDFIMAFPEQYDTKIGERGLKLSGGQRQRLTIARAILKDPAILILDEATSSLDSESEMIIQAAIDKLIENRTTIIIAHRLSTIMNADEILLLDKGRVIERGSHNDLIAHGGVYTRLCEFQFGYSNNHP